MNINEEMLKQKCKEIYLNMKYGKDSEDNIIKYNIDYLDGSNLTFLDNFNDQFKPELFIKRLLYDIKFNDQIKLIRLFITNKKYSDYKGNNHYYYINELLQLDDQLLDNIEHLEHKLKAYSLYSSKEFLEYNDFNDDNYKLINSMIDIINSNERIQYGYMINYLRRSKDEEGQNKIEIYHSLCSLHSIKNGVQTVQVDKNVYKAINFKNTSSKNYDLISFSSETYLKDNKFSKHNSKVFIKFPYLIEYIMDLINWKYDHKTDIIPDEVYDILKDQYMNNNEKVKEYIK